MVKPPQLGLISICQEHGIPALILGPDTHKRRS
jgi:hypothetical protein